MTQQHIDVVAAIEELVVIVSKSISVAPVAVILTFQAQLRHTIIAVLGILHGIGAPYVVSVFITPAITDLRTEGDMLPRLPVDACIVVLTETACLLHRSINTLERTAPR